MFKLSASKLRTYIACRKKYDFAYNEELEPIEKAECLTTGGNYHAKVANILMNKNYEETNDKTDVMAEVFKQYILPQLQKENIIGVEVHKEMQLDDDVVLHGYIDALTENGIPIEHKTTSKNVDEFYINRLNWDMQVAIYMILTGTNKCIYTVCQKPTIRQKQNETEEEFKQRCIDWYAQETYKKIGVFEVVRTDEELKSKLEELKQIANEIKNQKLYYRNSNECMILDCPYSSICLDYDKNVMPIGFQKKENEREEEKEND